MSDGPRAIAALFSLVLLAGCSLDYPQPKRYAIVYGVSIYQPGWSNNLTYPDIDAAAVRDMLSARGFDEVKTRISTDLLAERPSKANLQADIASLSAKVGPNDLVLFYYSGHGGQFDYQGDTREWIFPYGSVDVGPTYYTVLSNSIYDSELGTMLDVLPTKRRVVILDSCNSGGFMGSGLEADTVPPALSQHTTLAGKVTPATIIRAIQNYAAFSSAGSEGISPYKALVIAAAGADESSYEDGAPYDHGIATYYLLKAPASGDLNGDGVVTVLETFALMKAGIDETWNSRYAGSGYVFSPHVSGGPIDLALF
jgi:uncharacterized caspase-like protein